MAFEDALADALRAVRPVIPVTLDAPLGRAAFVGSGDSLASAQIAAAFGHRAMSSGDITWTGRVPVACDTVVGISHSGTSGATVRALRLARSQGLRTVAITSDADAPLAAAADEVQLVPTLQVDELVPVAGHIMLALGVAALCGADVRNATPDLASAMAHIASRVRGAVDGLPAEVPSSISVLALPELRSAADFWSLKLIEATGIATRNVPLEESGHVDYFIGPQAHLTIQLIGTAGQARFARLAEALRTTGQSVRPVLLDMLVDANSSLTAPVTADIAAAIVGAQVAQASASRWGRPPFRGGAVNMDAKHIKLDDEAPVYAIVDRADRML